MTAYRCPRCDALLDAWYDDPRLLECPRCRDEFNTTSAIDREQLEGHLSADGGSQTRRGGREER